MQLVYNCHRNAAISVCHCAWKPREGSVVWRRPDNADHHTEA